MGNIVLYKVINCTDSGKNEKLIQQLFFQQIQAAFGHWQAFPSVSFNLKVINHPSTHPPIHPYITIMEPSIINMLVIKLVSLSVRMELCFHSILLLFVVFVFFLLSLSMCLALHILVCVQILLQLDNVCNQPKTEKNVSVIQQWKWRVIMNKVFNINTHKWRTNNKDKSSQQHLLCFTYVNL